MHNLVTWLAEAGGVAEPPAGRVGETLKVAVATAGTTQVELTAPDGTAQDLPVQDATFAFRPDAPGFYGFKDGGEERLVPASFLLQGESDLLAGAGQAAPAPTLAAASAGDPGKTFWPMLLIAAVLLLLVDWVLLHDGRIT
jgi:hypothetical protein